MVVVTVSPFRRPGHHRCLGKVRVSPIVPLLRIAVDDDHVGHFPADDTDVAVLTVAEPLRDLLAVYPTLLIFLPRDSGALPARLQRNDR